jgi:MFS family permease
MIGPAVPTLPVVIALWSGVICLAIVVAVPTAGAIYGRIWGKPEERVRNLTGNVLAGAAVFAIPCAIAAVVAMVAGRALLALGAPPIVHPFVSLAGVVWLAVALRAPSHDMHGCTKLIGLIWSCYAIVWGMVAFHFTGGLAQLAAWDSSPLWLTPFLAALPFALLATRLKGDKPTARTFPEFYGFFAAFSALCYFPVEAGLAAHWLPASDWLRFPLAGLVVGLLLALVPLLRLIGGSATARVRRLRALLRGLLLGAALVAPTGLAWAAARAIILWLSEGA